MDDPQDLNIRLARALGVTDVENVAVVRLTLLPGLLPRLETERVVLVGEKTETLIQVLQLQPVETPEERRKRIARELPLLLKSSSSVHKIRKSIAENANVSEQDLSAPSMLEQIAERLKRIERRLDGDGTSVQGAAT